MLPQRTLEYLLYISLLLLLSRYAVAATAFGVPTAAANSITEDSTEATLTTITTATAGDSNTLQANRSPQRDAMRRAFGECDATLSWMCLKIEFVKMLERLQEREELSLMKGVSVVKDADAATPKTAEMMADVARSYPNDPSSRLNGYIVAKLGSFLQTHTLRFKLIDANTVAEARSSVSATARKGKFGKKGGMEALLAAGLMMKGTLMAIGMGAIALMAGKALMTALMALTLSGVLGLKSLAGGGGKSTTYEIVAKPIYTTSHSHSVSHDEGSGHAHGGGGGGHYSAGHSGSGYGGYARSLKLELPAHLQKPE